MDNQLSGVTNVTLSIINLNDKQLSTVSKCIKNYSYEPDGVTDQVSLLVYIIIEDIKFYFEASDWDKAVKALEEKGISLVPQVVVKILPGSTIHKASEYGLDKLIVINKIKTRQPPKQVTEFIEKHCTINHLVSYVGNALNNLVD